MISSPTLSGFELLAFYVEAGVDEAIGPDPIDRFAALPPPAAAPNSPVSRPVAAAANTVPASVQVPLAQTSSQLAQACSTLAELRQALESFDGLPMRKAALHTVFADGNPQAPVMFIGEAPGQEEDMQGLPFVGKSGKLLDRMLESIGLNRADGAYITNVVPWRPLDNRSPSLDEVAVCRPFLMRHIQLADPKLLVLLGGVPASAVLETSTGITRLRGAWQNLTVAEGSAPIPAMPTFHPSYLLRTPAGKRLAWRDLIEVKKRLESPK